MTSQRVVIIGAGAAGLAAASRLFRSGLQSVTVLEASDRIGGRVHSVDVDYQSSKTTEDERRHTIELGAQWVHGKVGNVSFELASKEGLLEDENVEEENLTGEFDEMTLVFDGDAVDIDLKSMGKLIENIYEKAENFQHSPTTSHGEFFNKMFEELIGEKDDDFKRKARIFKDFYHRLNRNIEGCTNWNQSSFDGMLVRYQKCPGKSRIAYKSDHKQIDLLSILAEDVPTGAIRLNSEVTKIFRGNPIQVQISGSEMLVADFVILTVSLGVLKARSESLFDPELPNRKLESIRTLEIGSVDKIFLEFDDIWWKPEEIGVGFAFMFAQSGDQKEDFGYTKEDAEKDWTRFFLGAYQVENRPRLLCFWLSGEGAKKMETLSDEQVKNDCMKTIRKFVASKYPTIPDPNSVKVTRWYSNPFTLGSYSYQTPAGEAASVTPDTLAEPLDNLLFAGEATHVQYFSTVHGAIESGYREADRILAKK